MVQLSWFGKCCVPAVIVGGVVALFSYFAWKKRFTREPKLMELKPLFKDGECDSSKTSLWLVCIFQLASPLAILLAIAHQISRNCQLSIGLAYVINHSVSRLYHLLLSYNIPNITVVDLAPKNIGVSRWNFVAIMSTSRDIRISRLEAAILNFWLPVTSDSISNSTVGFLAPENMGQAVGISFLSCLGAEI